ncbi:MULTISPECIES: DUF1963 domain-containing protein [unclassified Streptomyces]|uniref:DUF1963 domain-containing protein n=1 Tax=unclassified Streptomyces TaxID=2593676 RepID=UPI0013149C81|nr:MULTISPECIES: YwqG family protein [unclassified Streptomyces]
MIEDRYSSLAADHLPEALASRWTALLRPSARLRRAVDGEEAVAVLGGVPDLPADVAWPEWPPHGPLSFVASVDCAALPREALVEPFPRGGALLFFAFDGQADSDAFVSLDTPEGQMGQRVLHIPHGTPVSPAPTPPQLRAQPRVGLVAEPEQSAPDLGLPPVRAALLGDTGDGGDWPDPRRAPAELRPFLRAFNRLRGHIGHQFGGHALPIQGPVEYEVTYPDLGDTHSWGDRFHDEEAQRWLLLAQFEIDAATETSYGDDRALYWLIRPEDLAARRFDRARLTVQC